jgi:uncharacterized membrane-anchored protein
MNKPSIPLLSGAASLRLQPWLRLLVGAQVLVLLGIAGLAWATDHWGQTIRLHTRPVDPRDVLYGDYLRLSYDISEVDTAIWAGPGRLPVRGSSVWLGLAPGRASWQPLALSGNGPVAKADYAVLRGQVLGYGAGKIRIRYGLERYYLPQGTGQKLEAARDSAGLLVRVQVAPWGTVRLQGLEL